MGASELITSDGLLALGSRFPGYDASGGWGPVFQKHGVPVDTVKSFLLLHTHCVLQAVLTGYSLDNRRKMVEGAVSNLAERPKDYDFAQTFDDLGSVLKPLVVDVVE